MADFLLEIRSQEIPADWLERLVRSVTVRLFEELTSRGISVAEISTLATPRRVALSVRGLPEAEPENEHLELGPLVGEAWAEDGQATAAALDFAQKVGVDVASLERRATERGEYLASVVIEPGREIAQVLESLLPRLLRESTAKIPLVGSQAWPRPLTGLLTLLDQEILPLELDGFQSGRTSLGHAIFSPEPFEVEHWQQYRDELEKRGVVGGLDARRRLLREAVTQKAEELGGSALTAPGQLKRWAASCEIPGVLDGDLPIEALSLPAELLRTVLAERQDAIVLERGGEILPFFLAVMDRADDPSGRVRRGRQRAVAGDLLDALFDFERDRKVPLVKRVRRLEQLTFHEQLGTYAEKAQLLKELVSLACEELGWQDVAEHALEAATLAKADLTTAAVSSYPELHGRLGGVMARAEGYVEPVWQAIYDHNLPRPTSRKNPPPGPRSTDAEAEADRPAIPRQRAGLVLAVADRLGTLVGYFGLESEAINDDGRPSSSDPRGLRALGTGLLQLVIDGGLDLDLDLLAARAVLLYGDRLEHDAESILRRLQAFLDRRLDHLLGARGYGADEIEASKAVGTRDLPDLVARLEGLRRGRGSAELRQLVETARRISNMVRGAPEGEIHPELLDGGAEGELKSALDTVTPKVDLAVEASDYAAVIRHLGELVPALERFFAEVLVMDEDAAKRIHRLALLQASRRLCWRIARLAALDPEAYESTPAETSTPSKIPPWLESRSLKTD